MLSLYRFIVLLLTPICITYAESPYAPTTVGTIPGAEDIGRYHYDSAGNRLDNGHGQTMAMGLINKPTRLQTRLQTGDHIETFSYGPGGSRFMRVYPDRKTFYLNGMEYRINESGATTSLVQISANGYSPDVQVDTSNSENLKYTYFIKDHLGSPVLSIDSAASAATTPARFDPWGRRINASGVAQQLDKTLEQTRGYTGHELIASMGLNSRTGRVRYPYRTVAG
jgi:hypothetical protein